MSDAQDSNRCEVKRSRKPCGQEAVVVIRWDDGLTAAYCPKHRYLADSWIRTTKVTRVIWELQHEA